MFNKNAILLICISIYGSNAWSEISCSCTLIGDTGSKVMINNTLITLVEDNIPFYAADCQNIMVTEAAVDLCQTGKSCTRYTPNAKTPYTPCSSNNNEGGTWEKMHAMLKGNYQEKTGGKLLDEAGEIPGFPTGDILMPHKALKIPLDANTFPNGISGFTLTNEDTEQVVLEVGTQDEYIGIPRNNLKPGQGYLWHAKVGNTIHEGSFLVLPKSDALEVEALVKKYMGNVKRQSVAELFIRAAAYDEFDLQFNRDQILSEYHKETY